ncbi:2-oxoacid:ferredoxin oxidoreductase subunit beta [Natranaerobius thermophilus]|uniref:2-oxoglutarate ferredoxin oxidoreductase, beta subunit n=1 Tax=Natranaerobius thermophilus (strain ATCC BAA-1301 / DSM 18059 / JW/NM-WN-LF) TaxID=457570 RepID=B2A3W4_NATTJ|nr:2-oxoacid:ferredoxin oxidoreductase subunit beta [Natranaerobius thermophilus]ACB85066.1 2-oxoglutarate ferredoxin oxidoreductase, beta subunit [Natranaerobius thermophilus JW/NM-WN-LF]
MSTHLRKYLRLDKIPHIWCPGCGHGIILNSLIRGIHEVGLKQENTVIVSGIGCSSRAPGYLNFNTLHTTHGRALAFATGVKHSNPDLNVIVLTGDGDSAAIGGNHLIHAARRNINITTIVFNNNIYGMTSGQYSPMTPTDAIATTSPYGNVEKSFDLCNMVKSAGATFVGRGATFNTKQLIQLVSGALSHNGFSFVEALSQCPTYYGRRNNLKSAIDMLKWQKDNSVSVKAYDKLPEEKKEGKIVLGELFRDDSIPEYTDRYAEMVKNVQKRS